MTDKAKTTDRTCSTLVRTTPEFKQHTLATAQKAKLPYETWIRTIMAKASKWKGPI